MIQHSMCLLICASRFLSFHTEAAQMEEGGGQEMTSAQVVAAAGDKVQDQTQESVTRMKGLVRGLF